MRYYFNIRDQHGFTPDEEGAELPDLAAALVLARSSARDFVMDAMCAGRLVNGGHIEIANGEGTVLDSMAVRDVVN